nr:MAG TPA: hypothetical protein [Caudoviricetes sp.]
MLTKWIERRIIIVAIKKRVYPTNKWEPKKSEAGA